MIAAARKQKREGDPDDHESAQLVRDNAALRSLAPEFTVPIADVRAAYPAFAAKHQTAIDSQIPDGLHPGDLGHQHVTELLLPAIHDALRQVAEATKPESPRLRAGATPRVPPSARSCPDPA